MPCWITHDPTKFLKTSPNIVSCTGADMTNPFEYYHAMWKDGEGVSSGQHYWKFRLLTLHGGAAVGLTSLDRFKKDFQCRGLLYSEDLRNGAEKDRGLLVRKFGPKLEANDLIGILAVIDSVSMRMYIDVNGVSLGLAFNVPSSTFKSIFPMITFYLTGSATCTKHTEIPNLIFRAPVTWTDFEGSWGLINYNGMPLLFENQPRSRFDWISSRRYVWHIEELRTHLLKVNGIWKADKEYLARRYSDPRNREDLKVYCDLMAQMRTIVIDADGNLRISTEKMSTIWARMEPIPGPFVGLPFGVAPPNEQI